MKIKTEGEPSPVLDKHCKKKPKTAQKAEGATRGKIHTPSPQISSGTQATFSGEILKSFQESSEMISQTAIQLVGSKKFEKATTSKIATLSRNILPEMTSPKKKPLFVFLERLLFFLKLLPKVYFWMPLHFFDPSRTDLKMAHTRFHRTAIDGKIHKDSFDILDGGFCSTSFSHYIEYDLKPALLLLKESDLGTNKKAKKSLEQIETTLNISKTLFYFAFDLLPSFLRTKIILRKIHRLKEGETLIFPGGMKEHAILYEIKRTSEGVSLRVFNPGYGTRAIGSEFSVPEYKISDKNLKTCLPSLLSLQSLSRESILKNYSLSESDDSFLMTAIQKIIGETPLSVEKHTLQDRGNCFWKAFSTWTNSQLKGVSVTVTQKMVETSKTSVPYATEDLHLLATTREKIPLSRFTHRLAYEKVRTNLAKIFSTQAPQKTPVFKERKLRFFSFVQFHAWEEKSKVGRKESDEYISSLVHRIILEPAAKRCEKKALHRRKIILHSS